MTMSDNEIVRNYQEAKDKKAQIEILADLNCCQKKDICEVLSNNGVEIENKPTKRGRKPKSLTLTDLRLEQDKIEMSKGFKARLTADLQKEKEKADPVRDQVMIELKDKTVRLEEKKIDSSFSLAARDFLQGSFQDEVDLIDAEINKLTAKKDKLIATRDALIEYIGEVS